MRTQAGITLSTATLPYASWLHWPASSPHSLPAKALPGQGYAQWPQSPSLPCCRGYLPLLGVLVLTGVLVLPGVLGLPEVLVVPELLVAPEVLEPELPVVQEVLVPQQQKHALHLRRLPARWGFLASSKSGLVGKVSRMLMPTAFTTAAHLHAHTPCTTASSNGCDEGPTPLQLTDLVIGPCRSGWMSGMLPTRAQSVNYL